jgi:hypothetical protein
VADGSDLNGQAEGASRHTPKLKNLVGSAHHGMAKRRAVPIREAEHAKRRHGELVHFGPLDDLGETFLAIVENEHGELRYATLEQGRRSGPARRRSRWAQCRASNRAKSKSGPIRHCVANVAARTGGAVLHRPSQCIGHAGRQPGADGSQRQTPRSDAPRRPGERDAKADGVFQISRRPSRACACFERKTRYCVRQSSVAFTVTWPLTGPGPRDPVRRGSTASCRDPSRVRRQGQSGRPPRPSRFNSGECS